MTARERGDQVRVTTGTSFVDGFGCVSAPVGACKGDFDMVEV